METTNQQPKLASPYPPALECFDSFRLVGGKISHVHRNAGGSFSYCFTLHSPAEADENVFIPAASIAVYGYENMKTLRDQLNEAILDHEKRKIA